MKYWDRDRGIWKSISFYWDPPKQMSRNRELEAHMAESYFTKSEKKIPSQEQIEN